MTSKQVVVLVNGELQLSTVNYDVRVRLFKTKLSYTFLYNTKERSIIFCDNYKIQTFSSIHPKWKLEYLKSRISKYFDVPELQVALFNTESVAVCENDLLKYWHNIPIRCEILK